MIYRWLKPQTGEKKEKELIKPTYSHKTLKEQKEIKRKNDRKNKGVEQRNDGKCERGARQREGVARFWPHADGMRKVDCFLALQHAKVKQLIIND